MNFIAFFLTACRMYGKKAVFILHYIIQQLYMNLFDFVQKTNKQLSEGHIMVCGSNISSAERLYLLATSGTRLWALGANIKAFAKKYPATIVADCPWRK